MKFQFVNSFKHSGKINQGKVKGKFENNLRFLENCKKFHSDKTDFVSGFPVARCFLQSKFCSTVFWGVAGIFEKLVIFK